MNKYEFDNDKIRDIEQAFKTDRESVKKVNEIYRRIAEGMKHQYLAHVIRTVEEDVRKILNNPLFQIQVKPVDSKSPLLEFGSAQYEEGVCFTVYYHPLQDEKNLRIIIAHELGHLIIETMAEAAGLKKNTVEPLASIFGLITILDKNDFYATRAPNYQHSSWNELLKDFKLLKNQSEGIYNIS